MSYQNRPDQYPFFFYGTLRQGQENYALLRWRTVYEQPARALSMALYSLKQFPIMVPGDGIVYGDLITLHPRHYVDMLLELDYLEGYDQHNPINSLLRRMLIPVELQSGRQVWAWAYLCNRQCLDQFPHARQIEHGDWSFHCNYQLIVSRFGRYDNDIYGVPAGHTWQPNASPEGQRQDPHMPQESIFQWRDGEGWLVLTGSSDLTDSDTQGIIAEALARTVSFGPLAHIFAAGDIDTADEQLEILADMGSRTGYLVDIVQEDDQTLSEQLEQAGIILIGDGPNIEQLRNALEGRAHRSMMKAYQQGATIVGIGSGAAIMGQWMINNTNEVKPSFSWLKHAIVVIGGNDSPALDVVHSFLRQYPNAYGLGINQGAATAFSPNGALEVWGNQQITVILGKDSA